MTIRGHVGNLRSSRVLVSGAGVAAVALLGALAGGCAEDTSASTTTVLTGTSSTTGTGGNGGMGGSAGSGGTAGAGGVAGGGGAGGAMGCTSNSDCAGNPSGEVCELPTGLCVPCLPDQDVCPTGQYCTPQNNCVVGCTDDTDCTMNTHCSVQTNQCVGCTMDQHCPAGSICSGDTCYPGCSGVQPCQVGFSCCDQQCYELDKDVLHCGDCTTQCIAPANATPVCDVGLCTFACAGVYADCDQDPVNGCEHNTLQDGACVCVPGEIQPCYNGSPGTENVGVCKAGEKTCNADGLGFGSCVNAVLPSPETCNGLDDDCDGSPEAASCEPCVPGTGMCEGELGKWCKDGLGYVLEQCDPLQGTTCNPATGRCDGPCGFAALGTSYIGCDYWPVITANLVAATPFNFAVAVSNTGMSTATVTASKGATQLSVTTVPVGSVKIINLPWDLALKGPNDGGNSAYPASLRVNQGAYRIRSTQPVTVYQFSPLEYQVGFSYSYTNDASLLLPVNAWTGKYFVTGRGHWTWSLGASLSGLYAVVAREDNTTVDVTPGPLSGIKSGVSGLAANGAGQVVLNAGDVIQIVTKSGTNDLTGSLITADKSVQVISGHQCTFIPSTVGYCDHLEESTFPYETLASRYVVTATLINPTTTKAQMVRIVATKDNTALTYNPPQPGAPGTIATAGQYIELDSIDADFQITADNPILVTQYMTGQDAGGNAGDPAMTLAVATDQFRKSYLFHAPTNYSSNYVNVVAPTGIPVILDGALLGGFTPIGTTGYSVSRASLSNAGNGNHSISASQGIGITVYGYGQYTSYWYPGGLNLTKLHD